MQTKLSTKGQVVIPGPLRRRLGISAGDPLEVNLDSGRIVLTPKKPRPRRGQIVIDPVTRLPILRVGRSAPLLGSDEVEEILAKFP
jgi:AbrB family looped-hinge helix DNA binding protein